MDIINTPIVKLQIITLLDSICYGLLYGFLSPYLLSLGADHVVVATLAVGNLICNLVSADLINNLTQTHGKQYSLFLVFIIAMVSHLFMVLTGSYWCTIFARYIFTITNQSQSLCKDLLLLNAPKDEHAYYLAKYNILSGAGYVIGPFISGFIFSFGYFYDALFAAVLTFANICMIISVPVQDDMPRIIDERSFSEKSKLKADYIIHSFSKSDCKKNWDIWAIKFLCISSITIFFSKYTQILKHNFKATPFTIGCTASYMNSLTFAGTYLASNVRDYYSDHSVAVLAQHALIVIGASLLLACYSPVFDIYAVMCIPLIFGTSFMSSIWQELFKSRRNDSLINTNIYVGILAGLTTPLIFGIVCNIIGHHAVIIFSVLPIVASLFIISNYTLKYKLYDEEEEKMKDE